MDQRELRWAGDLHDSWTRARQQLSELDERQQQTTLRGHLDALVNHAAVAFMVLTGRHPQQVERMELDRDKPALWAQSHRPLIG